MKFWHRIALIQMRSDDFERFWTTRKSALLMLIEGAMGKQVNPETVVFE